MSFFIFSCGVAVCGIMSMLFSYYVMKQDGFPFRPDFYVFCCLFVFFEGIAAFVAFGTLIHASYNITTNERINRKRYDYLKDGKGRFYNPYNKGVARNLMEFMHMKKPPRDEEVELLGIDIV